MKFPTMTSEAKAAYEEDGSQLDTGEIAQDTPDDNSTMQFPPEYWPPFFPNSFYDANSERRRAALPAGSGFETGYIPLATMAF